VPTPHPVYTLPPEASSTTTATLEVNGTTSQAERGGSATTRDAAGMRSPRAASSTALPVLWIVLASVAALFCLCLLLLALALLVRHRRAAAAAADDDESSGTALPLPVAVGEMYSFVPAPTNAPPDSVADTNYMSSNVSAGGSSQQGIGCQLCTTSLTLESIL
jgi:hypothetical protein